jgi:hypothetical protein
VRARVRARVCPCVCVCVCVCVCARPPALPPGCFVCLINSPTLTATPTCASCRVSFCYRAVERVVEYQDQPEEAPATAAPPLSSSRSSSSAAAAAAAAAGGLFCAPGHSTTPQHPLLTSPPPGWPHAGAITAVQLSVSYRPGVLPPVVKALSFDVAPGQKVGICGRTGGGLCFGGVMRAREGRPLQGAASCCA